MTQRQRIDRWLWHARVVRTRSAAADLAAAGYVRVNGQRVDAGAVVVTVEAMKMEHALAAPVDGEVELLVAVGDQVKVGQPLARITAGRAGDSADASTEEDES